MKTSQTKKQILKVRGIGFLAIGIALGAALYAQQGTRVPTPLTTNPNATFPLGYANLMKGGFHQVQTQSELTNFPVSRQETGMIIYVVATDSSYRLMRTKTPPLTVGTDLVKVQSLSDGSGGGLSTGGNVNYILSGDGSGANYWIPDANGNLQNLNTGDVKLTSGTRLYFGETNQNGDPVYIERVDAGNNTSRLRINIGDENLGGGDGLEIGSNIAGSWNNLFTLNDRGIGIAFPRSFNTQGTTTRRINPKTVSDGQFTEYPNQTYGFNEAFTRCSCDTNDYAANCTLNQVVTTTASSCVDLKNISFGQAQSTCYNWMGVPYTCYEESTIYTYDAYSVSVETTQGSTQNYTMNYISTSGNQITIGDQTGSTTIDKTTTVIKGGVEMKNITLNTGTADINWKSLFVTSDGRVMKGKRRYQTFTAENTERNGTNQTTMWLINDGICFLTKANYDLDMNDRGQFRAGHNAEVYINNQGDGNPLNDVWMLRAQGGLRGLMRAQATCMSW